MHDAFKVCDRAELKFEGKRTEAFWPEHRASSLSASCISLYIDVGMGGPGGAEGLL